LLSDNNAAQSVREALLQFCNIPLSDGTVRRIAFIKTAARQDGAAEDCGAPGLIWLCGFRSKMTSVKASAVAEWAQDRGLACLRFDYSGHGQSPGPFEELTIGDWLSEAAGAFRMLSEGPQVIAASSMGGWIALLLARALRTADPAASLRLKGIVLLAPAWDMTEDLMWARASDEVKRELLEHGVCYRQTIYEEHPFPVTRRLIEEGRLHLLRGAPFDPGCPVRILHGMKDEDVPWRRSIELSELLQSDDLRLTLIKDADHRLGGAKELRLLFDAVQELCDVAG
jgi:pimeloyl-ACP methyl ester carboxylesterase